MYQVLCFDPASVGVRTNNHPIELEYDEEQTKHKHVAEYYAQLMRERFPECTYTVVKVSA